MKNATLFEQFLELKAPWVVTKVRLSLALERDATPAQSDPTVPSS
jgi:hypothetical protein